VHPISSGFLLSLSLCLDIGIVNVMIIRTALHRGSGAAFLIGAGSTLGDLVYAILSLLGITILLQIHWVRDVLWIGGTGVLLYFAVHMAMQALHPRDLGDVDTGSIAVETAVSGNERGGSGRVAGGASVGPRISGIRSFVSGIFLALSSPSAILWFASVGGSIIAADNHGTHQHLSTLWLFFVGFAAAGLCWSAAMAILVGKLGTRLGHTFMRGISLMSAGLFVYFAVHVFLQGLHGR